MTRGGLFGEPRLGGGSLRRPVRRSLVCPKCGGEAVAAPQHDTRFACADPRCPFKHGYRIEVWPPKAHHMQPDTLMAVPRNADGVPQRAAAVSYPHPKVAPLDKRPEPVQQ